jgi:hypothetical protein
MILKLAALLKEGGGANYEPSLLVGRYKIDSSSIN